PAARPTTVALATALPLAAMLLPTGGVLNATPPGYRLQLVHGTTWRTTVEDIVLLSQPPLAAAEHAMNQLAPTRHVLAGA
ncbi:NrsF family protein, partial [Burkholderia pseudomallei]